MNLRRLWQPRPVPAVPEDERVYAIGDIHGRADLLAVLLEQIHDDAADYQGRITLLCVGDYVDRGPDSRGVVEQLLQPFPGWATAFLLGNHDWSLLQFIDDAQHYRGWKGLGADPTLLSYGVRPPLLGDVTTVQATRDRFAEQLPDAHLTFFRNLRTHIEIGDYYFVHAGVRPGRALDCQQLQDQLWIREEFLDSDARFRKCIVHGHSPFDSPLSTDNRIAIDTAAYATGRLTALVLEGRTRRFLST